MYRIASISKLLTWYLVVDCIKCYLHKTPLNSAYHCLTLQNFRHICKKQRACVIGKNFSKRWVPDNQHTLLIQPQYTATLLSGFLHMRWKASSGNHWRRCWNEAFGSIESDRDKLHIAWRWPRSNSYGSFNESLELSVGGIYAHGRDLFDDKWPFCSRPLHPLLHSSFAQHYPGLDETDHHTSSLTGSVGRPWGICVLSSPTRWPCHRHLYQKRFTGLVQLYSGLASRLRGRLRNTCCWEGQSRRFRWADFHWVMMGTRLSVLPQSFWRWIWRRVDNIGGSDSCVRVSFRNFSAFHS